MKKNTLGISCAVVSLAFLPSCDWFGSTGIPEKSTATLTQVEESVSVEAPKGEVLLTVKGKSAVTVPQFEEYLNEVIKAQPQLKQLMAFMPDAEYEFFKSMQNEIAIEQWIKDQKINERADFQKDRKMGIS
jgi:hypothetical protein